MLVAMVIVGSWVSGRIEESVVHNSANATAQYMESFISPLSQDLERSDTLPPGALRALDEIFTNTTLAERVMAFKIWKPGGLVVESSDKSIVGQRFPESDQLKAAFAGEVSATFDKLSTIEDANPGSLGMPMLEVYSPIREVWSGKIIGVAEFYETAAELKTELADVRRRSWLTVALVMLTIGALLYGIVLNGSRTIERQSSALGDQLTALAELSERNTALRLRIQGAAARASAMNDTSLRQIGADLHDGPAQLLGFAALRLDDIRPSVAGDAAQADLDQIDRAVKDAIREIRSISRGLSLPDIETRSPGEVLRGVIDAHKARTGTEVLLDCDEDSLPLLSPAVKICLYRFVQEGLNNAWRYADGQGQEVRLSFARGRLKLVVADRGPGFSDTPEPSEDDRGLGLVGLRDRVESLGGTLELRNRSDGGGGAEMVMILELGRT
ncbi:histidine kinase [Rhodobacter ferrooxidans]|uniref:histidine kinase n=2 Tax=Rhodobacter ferrooxidans TaxID=371731 RepID=C8S301_9RHOB|nr:histidine kinase [Rhodobacter sp. SW2]